MPRGDNGWVSETATQIEADRERLTAFRDSQAIFFDRLSAHFDAIIRVTVGPTASGSATLDGNGVRLVVQLGGERSTAAIESLKIIAFDLAVMCMGIEGETHLPALLVHDSPREADLGLSVYHRLFSMVATLEGPDSSAFQYIVTTTTQPPPVFQRKPAADAIDWSAPRLVCIAADFTKYDGHAVQQINRNIELIRYRRFGEELLLLELANATSANNGKSAAGKADKPPKGDTGAAKPVPRDRSFAEWLPLLPPHLMDLLASLEDYVLSLGDDVQRKELRLYLAFKRLKNFATVVVQKNRLLLYLHLKPEQLAPLPAIGRDVSQQGHWGTGDLELSLASQTDLDAAKPLILMSYEGRGAALGATAKGIEAA